MEEKKKGTGILIFILFLVIAGLTVYIVYDKAFAPKSSTGSEASSDKTTSKVISGKTTSKEGFSLSNKNSIQALSFNSGYALVDKNGDVFLNFYDRDLYGHDLTQLYGDKLQTLKNMYEKHNIKGYHTNPCDGEAEVYSGIKLSINKVVGMYHLSQGNGDYNYLIFVKEDGSLSAFGIEKTLSSGELYIKEDIDGLKNIVSVVQSNTVSGCSEAREIAAIESNGKIHILSALQ